MLLSLLIPALVATPVMEQLVAEDAREEHAKDSAPVYTLLLPLTFASAPEMAQLVSPFLSTSGKVWADPRTSTLLIQDSRESIDRIRELVREFDVPTPLRGPVVILRKVELPGDESDVSKESEGKVTDAIAPVLVPARSCFAKALSRRPELGGFFWVALTFDPSGRVSAVRVEGSRPELPQAASDCIRDAFQTLHVRDITRTRVELVYGIGLQRQ